MTSVEDLLRHFVSLRNSFPLKHHKIPKEFWEFPKSFGSRDQWFNWVKEFNELEAELKAFQKQLSDLKQALATDHHLPQCCEKNVILVIDTVLGLPSDEVQPRVDTPFFVLDKEERGDEK